MKIKTIVYTAVSLILVVATSGCGSTETQMQTPQAASGGIDAAHAIVTGRTELLYAFNQHLKDKAGDFDTAGIKCTGCDSLSATPGDGTPGSLDYVFFGSDQLLAAFASSWAKVEAATPDMTFTIALDSAVTTPDCAVNPQPCVGAAFCTKTPGCSKTKLPPCTKCGT